MTVVNGIVLAEESTFYITDPNPPPRWHRKANTRENGLIGATEGAALIRTGCSHGPVNVGVELLDSAPKAVASGWDNIVEISYRTERGQSYVGSWNGGGTDFPSVSFQGPGTYRLRVHARGRDIRRDGVATEPVEDYLIQVWPAPEGPTAILQTHSESG